ncbi:MAG: helix-turn-helix transcriptional regulator [Clostridia bacterium]|nr:helix-turn-helix transcriptional regulator [Clostridia bacterium]
MSIGNNIYTLRKEKKITQAQLAEKLGVSDQAVSKWENDLCAPDVSMFPILAEYFGVSIDRLFGYYLNSHEQEISAIIKAADESMDTYKEIEILSEGLKKFPNSPDLKINLAFSLSMINRISQDETEKSEAIKKAIKVCTEVVDHCGDVKQADRALNMLNRIYAEIGEYGKAMDVIDKMSGESYYFRVVGIARTLAHKHDDKELERFVEKNLFDCWLAMDLNLDMLTSRYGETEQFDKCIAFCKARLNLLAVFDDGCPDFYATHKFFTMLSLAHTYRKTGDKAACLETLYSLAALFEQVEKVAQVDDHRVSARNTLYFSHIHNDEMMEEYSCGFKMEHMLGAFDAFFGEDEEYKTFKQTL